jgi:hypothetical protein
MLFYKGNIEKLNEKYNVAMLVQDNVLVMA